MDSSIYQDVPLYSVHEFEMLAPPEARTDAVLADSHQLMLNRLSFELAERQRFAVLVNHMHFFLDFTCRLDLKKKELMQQKEDLLAQSKNKNTTLDSVKLQIDTLVKVRGLSAALHVLNPVFLRQLQRSKKRSTNLCYLYRIRTMTLYLIDAISNNSKSTMATLS
jgi:hypothetical protein